MNGSLRVNITSCNLRKSVLATEITENAQYNAHLLHCYHFLFGANGMKKKCLLSLFDSILLKK